MAGERGHGKAPAQPPVKPGQPSNPLHPPRLSLHSVFPQMSDFTVFPPEGRGVLPGRTFFFLFFAAMVNYGF